MFDYCHRKTYATCDWFYEPGPQIIDAEACGTFKWWCFSLDGL